MLVSEVVAAIQQRNSNFIDPVAILREITQVRDRLLRTPGGGQQQSDTVVTMYDLEQERNIYPLPAPASAIVAVVLQDDRYAYYGDEHDESDNGWYTLPRKQFDEREGGRPYFYITGGFIGLSRKPQKTTTYGMKIIHYPVLLPLGIESLTVETSTGIDPNFDMLLVYGVLREITMGSEANEYSAKYQEIYDQYTRATNGFETYRVKRRW